MAGRQERAGFRLHKTYCWGPSADLHTLAFFGEQSSKLQASRGFGSHPRSRLPCKPSISVPWAKTWASHPSPPPSLTGPTPVSHFESFPQIHSTRLEHFHKLHNNPLLQSWGSPTDSCPASHVGPQPCWQRVPTASEAPVLHSCGSHLSLAEKGVEGLGTSTCKWHWWCALWPKGQEPPGGHWECCQQDREGCHPLLFLKKCIKFQANRRRNFLLWCWS